MNTRYECQGCEYRWTGTIKTLQELPRFLVPAIVSPCCGAEEPSGRTTSKGPYARNSRCKGEDKPWEYVSSAYVE